MPQIITVRPQNRIDDNIAIDATSSVATEELKSLCFAWHGNANADTIPALSPSPIPVTVPVFKARLAQRAAGVYDCHLVVSQQIFDRFRAAWTTGYKLKLSNISDNATNFSVTCSNNAAIVDGESYLQGIFEATQATSETVSALAQDVASIKNLLNNALLNQAAALSPSLKSNGQTEEYHSTRS